MEVRKFAPREFRALPNNDMMFLVDWEFLWLQTNKLVTTTAVVRKVVKDGKICEKYHMVDCDAVLQQSPRDVIAGTAAAIASGAAAVAAGGRAGAGAALPVGLRLELGRPPAAHAGDRRRRLRLRHPRSRGRHEGRQGERRCGLCR